MRCRSRSQLRADRREKGGKEGRRERAHERERRHQCLASATHSPRPQPRQLARMGPSKAMHQLMTVRCTARLTTYILRNEEICTHMAAASPSRGQDARSRCDDVSQRFAFAFKRPSLPTHLRKASGGSMGSPFNRRKSPRAGMRVAAAAHLAALPSQVRAAMRERSRHTPPSSNLCIVPGVPGT